MQKKSDVHRISGDYPRITRPGFSPTHGSSPTARKSPKLAYRPLEQLAFPSLLPLGSANKNDVNDLFRQKCKIALQKCSFDAGVTQFVRAKEELLRDILSALTSREIALDNDITNWESVFTLVSAHLVRSPLAIPREWFSVHDWYCLSDVCHPQNWIHLSIIYDIIIAFLSTMKCDCERKLEWCRDLLALTVYLCRTPDDREQSKLGLLFLAVYEYVTELRSIAWTLVTCALSRILYDDEPFVSARPILRSFAGVIAGLKTPLGKVYRDFFHDVLLPLHRNQFLVYFANELFTCVTQFLEKDHQLVLEVFVTILRYWPRLQPQKQILILEELSYMASFVEDEWVVQCVRLVGPRIAISLRSCHAGISEKILGMWEVNDFAWMMAQNPAVSYPLLIPHIFEAGRTYWLPEIRFLCAAVLRTMQENDDRAFNAVGVNLRKIQSLDLTRGLDRAAKWKFLICTHESDPHKKAWNLHMLAALFDGCESLDPYRRS
jgi:hypothetical protein